VDNGDETIPIGEDPAGTAVSRKNGPNSSLELAGKGMRLCYDYLLSKTGRINGYVDKMWIV
jgi:hypothetical protein